MGASLCESIHTQRSTTELLGEAFMQMGRYVGKAQGVGGGKRVLSEPDPRKIEKEGLAYRPGWKCTLCPV